LLLFLEKEEYYYNIFNRYYWPIKFLGHAAKPPGSASPRFGPGIVFREAEQRFLLLFLEKEEYYYNIFNRYYRSIRFLGVSPQTPRVGFAEFWAWSCLPRSGTTLFASFSGKRRILLAIGD
jgi:hypothetical protein